MNTPGLRSVLLKMNNKEADEVFMRKNFSELEIFVKILNQNFAVGYATMMLKGLILADFWLFMPGWWPALYHGGQRSWNIL